MKMSNYAKYILKITTNTCMEWNYKQRFRVSDVKEKARNHDKFDQTTKHTGTRNNREFEDLTTKLSLYAYIFVIRLVNFCWL